VGGGQRNWPEEEGKGQPSGLDWMAQIRRLKIEKNQAHDT
jgi:hypothetical protein